MITHELMRELLNDDLTKIQDIAEFVPNEIVYKALIIREFMREQSIQDPRQGIRKFYAFERERLEKLGLLQSEGSPIDDPQNQKPLTSASHAAN